jgi:hypothetical protein
MTVAPHRRLAYFRKYEEMHVSICTKDSIEILRAAALAKGHLKRVGQEMAMHVNSKSKIYAEQCSYQSKIYFFCY